MFNLDKGLKLRSIDIKNYKILQDFKINFTDKNNNPLPIIVIAGVNGTGKTTILDSVYNKNLNNSNMPMSFEYYESNKIKKDIKVDIRIDNKNKTINGPLNKESSLNEPKPTLEELFIQQHINYIFLDNKFLDDFKKFIPKYIEQLLFEEDVKASQVYKKISKYMIDIFKDMNILITFDKMDRDKQLFFKNRKGDSFSINDISTGEKVLIENILYLYLIKVKDSVILIDEPELSLHPSWQNKILRLYEKYAKKYNCQIIIATHSPQIIGSAKNEYLRLLSINEKSEIEVINDVLAYGRDIEWVLEEVMGTKYTREKTILDKFDEVQNSINNEKFDKAEAELNKLEIEIGEHDNDILKLRNDLAFERMDFEEDS